MRYQLNRRSEQYRTRYYWRGMEIRGWFAKFLLATGLAYKGAGWLPEMPTRKHRTLNYSDANGDCYGDSPKWR